MTTAKYEKNLYMAMLSEQCHRYDEMVNYLEEMIKTRDKDISTDERNLLSVAYKNLLLPLRLSLRTVMAYETKEKKKEVSSFLPYIREYREKIENEITKNCQNVITIVENDLLKKASETESKVFYIKMKADYNRFICEYAVGDLKEKVLKDALTCYQEADNLAKELPVLNITSLGLSLNYCVFYYEAMNDTKFAIKIADNAYEKVSKEFNNIDENAEENKNVIAIIRLIKENLDMWKSEVEEALKSKNTK